MKTIALKTAVLFGLIVAASTSSGCIIVSDSTDSSLTVDNASDYVLTELRIARTDVDEPYGPNLIPDALFPDESITIDLDCDFYDVLVADDGSPPAECELIDLDLCFDDAIWTLTNADLDSCAFN